MRAHDPPERDAPNRHTQPTRPGTGTAPLTSSMAAILTLQRRAGNAAVTRAVQRQRSDHGHSDHEHHDGRRPEAQPVQRSTVHDVLRSAGTPLAEPVRRDMETRLGADFSDVRLHTDALAQRSAAEIGARAYTSGSHVVIGAGGGDRHTLAHELTHVIQQRSGPVAGADAGHGLRVSDPGDAYERAAEANATRALAVPRPDTRTGATADGGEAVQCAPEAGSTVHSNGEGSVPVQRWAWIGQKQIRPNDPLVRDNETMRGLAGDDKVRVYEDEEEFRGHAAGATDHIGNLPDGSPRAGTWVRFERTGTNLLGEDHQDVMLQHVLNAVGSTSFIYEAFAVDDMSSIPNTKAQYEQESQDNFSKFNTGGVTDKRKFGAESLFPKLGFFLNHLSRHHLDPERPALKGYLDPANALAPNPLLDTPAGPFDYLRPPSYGGQPHQRVLRIAWTHTQEVAQLLAQQSTLQKIKPSKAWHRKEQVKNLTGMLNSELLANFMAGLLPNDHLGVALETYLDRLDPGNRRSFVTELRRFCDAYVAALLVRIGSDEVLTGDEKKELKKQRKDGDAGAVFSEWRDMHFLHATRKAVRDGVRYVGMGRIHANYVEKHLAGQVHVNDMAGTALSTFIELTDDRREEAERQAAAEETSPADPASHQP